MTIRITAYRANSLDSVAWNHYDVDHVSVLQGKLGVWFRDAHDKYQCKVYDDNEWTNFEIRK